MGYARELAELATAYNTGNPLTHRNKIINGGMVIDQRNAGASVTPANGGFGTDRWKFALSQASKLTCQQTSTAPVGFTKSLAITSSSAYTVGSTELFLVSQLIEGFNVADLGWGTANAKTVTLSFWVRSSLTGTFGGAVKNSNAGVNDRSYPFSYTVSVANIYEYKTITIAGDTTGTWNTDNTAGLVLSFGLGVGSTLSNTAGAWAAGAYHSATGATSVVGTNGATFYITGVQLEAGRVATPFEMRQYGTELALCQRYFEKSYDINVAPGTAGNGYSGWTSSGSHGGLTTAYIDGRVDFKVTKRTNPTIAIWDEANGSGTCTRVDPGILATSGQSYGSNAIGMSGYTASSSSGTNAGRFAFNWTATAEL